MLASKEKIASSFSKGALHYEKIAHIQKLCSEELVNLIKETLPSFYPRTILDIGTGTGFMPHNLMKKYPFSCYDLNDLSLDMLKVAQQKFGFQKKINYILGDAEKLSFKNYDLITSNMVFQWFHSLQENLIKLLSSTQVFAFTILLEGTFKEWHTRYENAGLIPSMLCYPSKDDVLHLFESMNAEILTCVTKNFPLCFDSPLSFVKYLKALGASAKDEFSPTSQAHIRYMYKDMKPLETKYHVLFIVLKKGLPLRLKGF